MLVSSTYWYFIHAIQPADTGWYVCHVSVNNYCLNRSAYYHLINNCGVTLPVQLVLAAQKTATGNQLSWNTRNETGIKEYSIERSSNGSNGFKAIAGKQYAGSGTANKYLYTDEAPMPGNNYYRLKITGINGTAMYSNTVMLKGNGSTVSVYPNPVLQQLYVDLSTVTAGTYSIGIYSAAGEIVYRQTINTSQNRFAVIDRTVNMPAGIYMVAITNKATGGQQHIKVMFR